LEEEWTGWESTLNTADQVVFMEHGRIEEFGIGTTATLTTRVGSTPVRFFPGGQALRLSVNITKGLPRSRLLANS
jgi:hypothetical protein